MIELTKITCIRYAHIACIPTYSLSGGGRDMSIRYCVDIYLAKSGKLVPARLARLRLSHTILSSWALALNYTHLISPHILHSYASSLWLCPLYRHPLLWGHLSCKMRIVCSSGDGVSHFSISSESAITFSRILQRGIQARRHR